MKYHVFFGLFLFNGLLDKNQSQPYRAELQILYSINGTNNIYQGSILHNMKSKSHYNKIILTFSNWIA